MALSQNGAQFGTHFKTRCFAIASQMLTILVIQENPPWITPRFLRPYEEVRELGCEEG